MSAIKASDIRVGDLIDLEGDEFADPKHDKPEFECELVEVYGVELETPTCIRLDFDGHNSVGFPVGHLIQVERREPHAVFRELGHGDRFSKEGIENTCVKVGPRSMMVLADNGLPLPGSTYFINWRDEVFNVEKVKWA